MTKCYGWLRGVPLAPSGRRSSVPGGCPKRQQRSSARLPATTRWGDSLGRVPPTHALAGGLCAGAPQPPAGATPPRAPQCGSPGALMACCGGGRLLPPSLAPWQGLQGLSPHRERHPEVSPAGGAPPLPGPVEGFLEAPTGRAHPAIDHRTQLNDRLGGTHCRRGVGVRMEPVVRNNAAIVPLEGSLSHTRPRPMMIHRAGPECCGTRRPQNGCRRPRRPTRCGEVICPRSSAPPPLPRAPCRQHAASHGDTHMGVQRGHRLVAPS